VAAVDQGYDELVELIEARLKSGWRFPRLSLAEQLILLLGTAEIIATDRGTSGIIAAWTRMADLFGEPNSHRFVNGVLTNLASART
jgi:transcription termination factor NusB